MRDPLAEKGWQVIYAVVDREGETASKHMHCCCQPLVFSLQVSNIRIYKTELDGKTAQLNRGSQAEFFHDLCPVGFHRTDTDA